jgi:hypothetical protein
MRRRQTAGMSSPAMESVQSSNAWLEQASRFVVPWQWFHGHFLFSATPDTLRFPQFTLRLS